MEKNNILVVGTFTGKIVGGQHVKVRNTYRLIQDHYVDGKVRKFDTEVVRHNPLKLFRLFFELLRANIAVASLAQRGLSLIFPIIYWLSKVFSYEIVFVCIGGWQTEFFLGKESNFLHFKPHLKHMKMAKKIKGFLPEISTVYDKLKSQCGFGENMDVFPNFRYYNFKFVDFNHTLQLKLVFCARVAKQKGYDMIFQFLENIKDKHLNIKVDIYGPIQDGNGVEFFDLLNRFDASVVEYKGTLPYDTLFETLCHYDILLFPTHYYNEGFPGTILDAYISGIPVIATEWVNAHIYVKNGITGYIVPFENGQIQFDNRILELYNDREKLLQLKHYAHEESYKYDEKVVWKVIEKYL